MARPAVRPASSEASASTRRLSPPAYRGGRRLTAGSVGSVQTAAGIRVPFEVSDFVDGWSWSWDVAGVAAFLGSPIAGLLTGVALVADGGQSFSGSAMLAEMMLNP